MIRNTLKEFIELFNTNEMHKYAAIRGMEQLGEWAIAATYWEKMGKKDDADACRLLQKAIDEGDAFRNSTRHLTSWVDETVEKGIMTKQEAVKVVYPEMQQIYKEYYGKQ